MSKICAIIKNGAIMEVSIVDNHHKFGDHGDHYHMPAPPAERHGCSGREAEVVRADVKAGKTV